MKVKIEFDIAETGVMKKIAQIIVPGSDVEKDEHIECAFGSAGQTFKDDKLTVDYSIDSRILPGLYSIYEKHEAEITGIVMMVSGLAKTVSVAISGIAGDCKNFFKDFEETRKQEMAQKDDATVEPLHPETMRHEKASFLDNLAREKEYTA